MTLSDSLYTSTNVEQGQETIQKYAPHETYHYLCETDFTFLPLLHYQLESLM